MPLPRLAFRHILPPLQLVIFLAVAIPEHRESLAKNPKSNFEPFGCLKLDRHPHSPPVYDPFAYECSGGNPERVELLNLPVTMLAFLSMGQSGRLGISQVTLFYGTMLIGIPFFWYGLGFLIDRRRTRRARNVVSQMLS